MSQNCHIDCPLTTGEFRDRVLNGLENLSTKMNILVGPDGNNGELSRVKATLEEHSNFISNYNGVVAERERAANHSRWVLGIGAAILAGVISWFLSSLVSPHLRGRSGGDDYNVSQQLGTVPSAEKAPPR